MGHLRLRCFLQDSTYRAAQSHFGGGRPLELDFRAQALEITVNDSHGQLLATAAIGDRAVSGLGVELSIELGLVPALGLARDIELAARAVRIVHFPQSVMCPKRNSTLQTVSDGFELRSGKMTDNDPGLTSRCSEAVVEDYGCGRSPAQGSSCLKDVRHSRDLCLCIRLDPVIVLRVLVHCAAARTAVSTGLERGPRSVYRRCALQHPHRAGEAGRCGAAEAAPPCPSDDSPLLVAE